MKPVNRTKTELWKSDIQQSVDFFNQWFLNHAPLAFRETRLSTTKDVQHAFEVTRHLSRWDADVLIDHPEILPTLRMVTCPPLARDRLTGLAGSDAGKLVKKLEGKNPVFPRKTKDISEHAVIILGIIKRLIDHDIFPWLNEKRDCTSEESYRAATIIADRLCSAVANPIIRNSQEKRQLETIQTWLEKRDYRHVTSQEISGIDDMPEKTFCFRYNLPAGTSGHLVNIPIDVVVMRKKNQRTRYPLLIEAKSAGDFTNVNKRRKEEAQKITQLRATYGDEIQFILFLCGYFDSGYLGYEAAEGIDWVWEHRLSDLEKFGL